MFLSCKPRDDAFCVKIYASLCLLVCKSYKPSTQKERNLYTIWYNFISWTKKESFPGNIKNKKAHITNFGTCPIE